MLGLALLASACHGATGLHVFAHLGKLDYDALALEVTRPADTAGAAPQVLVDPATTGRYAGPFQGGDQDVYVYLPDDLDGARLQCTMTALRDAAAVGQGQADATVHREAIEAVDISMASADETGDAGTATGTGGGAQKTDNGGACNTGSECASSHCVDGVCCESDCSSACSSCATPGAAGLCRPAPAGLPDPRGICTDMGAATCGTNGLCDVSGHCAQYPAGTTCAAPSCKNGEMMKGAATCDGAGACMDGPTVKCSGHCDADGCQ